MRERKGEREIERGRERGGGERENKHLISSSTDGYREREKENEREKERERKRKREPTAHKLIHRHTHTHTRSHTHSVREKESQLLNGSSTNGCASWYDHIHTHPECRRHIITTCIVVYIIQSYTNYDYITSTNGYTRGLRLCCTTIQVVIICRLHAVCVCVCVYVCERES